MGWLILDLLIEHFINAMNVLAIEYTFLDWVDRRQFDTTLPPPKKSSAQWRHSLTLIYYATYRPDVCGAIVCVTNKFSHNFFVSFTRTLTIHCGVNVCGYTADEAEKREKLWAANGAADSRNCVARLNDRSTWDASWILPRLHIHCMHRMHAVEARTYMQYAVCVERPIIIIVTGALDGGINKSYPNVRL